MAEVHDLMDVGWVLVSRLAIKAGDNVSYATDQPKQMDAVTDGLDFFQWPMDAIREWNSGTGGSVKAQFAWVHKRGIPLEASGLPRGRHISGMKPCAVGKS